MLGFNWSNALCLLCCFDVGMLSLAFRGFTLVDISIRFQNKFPLAVAVGDDSSQDSDDDSYQETAVELARRRRVRRGPIRPARLSVAAQDVFNKQQKAQNRQKMAQKDPTLLADSFQSNDFGNHTVSIVDTNNYTTYASWESAQALSTTTLRAVAEMIGNETKMTRVQAVTFPWAREGWSLRVRSKTGSGKTLAFLVPLLERVLTENPLFAISGGRSGIRLLIVVPTRELAQQIGKTADDLLLYHQQAAQSQSYSPAIQVVHGGHSVVGQIRNMERKGVPSILVATPGRLVELLDRKVRGRMFKKYLMLSQEVTTITPTSKNDYMMVVLDEADHLLKDFGPEIKTIFHSLPRKRQLLLFSATLMTKQNNSTQSYNGRNQRFDVFDQTIMGQAIRGIRDIDCVTSSSSKQVTDMKLETKGNSAVNVNVQEFCLSLSNMNAYLPTLLVLLQKELELDGVDNAKIIVFFPANKLVQFMGKAAVEVNPKLGPLLQVIHSRMSPSARQRSSRIFFEMPSGILFTSDVTARGMDYPNVTTVIQYGLPEHRELYLHRLGRTARAGHSGKGVLVALPFESIASLRLRKEGLKEIPPISTHDNNPALVVKSAMMVAYAEAAYKAFVAYYVGKRHDKQVVLRAAAELSQSVGLINLPQLPDKIS